MPPTENIYDPTDASNVRNRTMVTTQPAPVAASSPGLRGFGVIPKMPLPATGQQVADADTEYKLLLGESIQADAAAGNAGTTLDGLNDQFGKADKPTQKALQPDVDAAKTAKTDADAKAKDLRDKVTAAREKLDLYKSGKPIPVEEDKAK